MLNYAPRFNRNSITEIIKKMVYLPSAWTIIWLLSYQQLAVLQFLVHRVFLLNKCQTFSYKFHEQVAKWNFELLNPIMKDITKSIIEKIFLKALLAVVQLSVVIEVSTGAVHYGPLCTIWILGTEEFRGFQLFVWITNRRDSEVVCTSLHIALLGLLRHLLTLLKPKQYHLCSGYSSYSDFCRSNIFPHPSSCRLLSMVEVETKENKGWNHYLVGTRSLREALFGLMRFQ